MNPKTKKIIEDAEREGIPIFVFTAKDLFSIPRLREYKQACFDSKCCPDKHIAGIENRIAEFENWQKLNKDKVKFPT